MLIGALVSMLGVAIFGVVSIVLWPVLPLLVLILPILALTGGN